MPKKCLSKLYYFFYFLFISLYCKRSSRCLYPILLSPSTILKSGIAINIYNSHENCSHAFTTRKRDVIYVFMSICASKVVYTKWLCHARLVSESKDNKLIGNGTMYNNKNEGLLSDYDKDISQKLLILKPFWYTLKCWINTCTIETKTVSRWIN